MSAEVDQATERARGVVDALIHECIIPELTKENREIVVQAVAGAICAFHFPAGDPLRRYVVSPTPHSIEASSVLVSGLPGSEWSLSAGNSINSMNVKDREPPENVGTIWDDETLPCAVVTCNCYLPSADLVLGGDGKPSNFMPRIDGKPFRCTCGCNVFRKSKDGSRYFCNACPAVWVGE